MVVALTKDYISYLVSNAGSEVDLGKAEQALSASKRRLYDVTNVLAGVGLIKRRGKSQVRWVGRHPRADHPDADAMARRKEASIDAMLAFVDGALSELLESPRFQEHGWLSEEDIEKLDPEGSVHLFALRGPPSMTIDFADQEAGTRHMVCRAEHGRIEMIPIGERRRAQSRTRSTADDAPGD
jgi:transcription factor E2F3